MVSQKTHFETEAKGNSEMNFWNKDSKLIRFPVFIAVFGTCFLEFDDNKKNLEQMVFLLLLRLPILFSYDYFVSRRFYKAFFLF